MPQFEDHECLLLTQEDDIVKSFIDTGIFISLRRKFRAACMISRSHPLTAGYFKSHASCRNEQIRHLIHYYYMIHPFSMLNLSWEFFMFFVYASQFTLIPIDASHQLRFINYNVYLTKTIVDMVQLVDVVKLFYTGYYDHQKSKVILERSKVAKRYLLSFFFVDIISSGYSYLYPFIHIIMRNIPDPQMMSFVRLLNRLKIIRMPRWLSILELFRQYMGYSSYLFKGIRVVLIFLMVTFWSFSITFFIQYYVKTFIYQDNKNMTPDEVLIEVCKNYHAATVMLLVVSIGGKHISTILQFANVTFFLCFGFGLQMFLYAQILQVWTKYASAENKHHSLHEQFKEYMKYKELPVILRERIFSYFEFKFHKQFFKESDINSMVSPILRQEILLHVTRNHIEKVDFFKYLPENILMKVVAHLKSEIYLPGDVIISAGSIGYCMFFIYHGTVAVYTPLGKEICHLEDGAHFGEIALIFNETRVASVVAVTACELFMLKRSDFLETIEPFPEFKEELLALATERLHKTILQSE